MTNEPTTPEEIKAIKIQVCGSEARYNDAVQWMDSKLKEGSWTQEEYEELIEPEDDDLYEIRETTKNLYDAYMRAKP